MKEDLLLPGIGVADFTPEQKDIQRLAREFTKEYVAPIADEVDAKDNIPPGMWKKAAQSPYHFLGMCIPKKYGGRGAPLIEGCIVIEEVAYASISIATLLEVTTLVPLVIVNAGTEEQKRKYLKPVTAGESFIGIMITDEGAGSDAADAKTTAVKKGNNYVVDGRKRLVSFADYADKFIVLVRTDPTVRKRGTGTILLEARETLGGQILDNLKGHFTLGKKHECMGMKGHRTWDVIFDNCEVPVDNLIGEEGDGLKNCLVSLDDSRATVGSIYIGGARAAFDIAMKFAKERISFDVPLNEYQGISFPLAEVAAEIEAARLLSYKAAWLADKGMWHKKETSMSKSFAADVAIRACQIAISTLGGEGTTDLYPVERIFRDVLSFQFAQGSPGIQKFITAREIFRE